HDVLNALPLLDTRLGHHPANDSLTFQHYVLAASVNCNPSWSVHRSPDILLFCCQRFAVVKTRLTFGDRYYLMCKCRKAVRKGLFAPCGKLLQMPGVLRLDLFELQCIALAALARDGAPLQGGHPALIHP